MIKIRLSRGGVKKDPFYRIVATDESKAREGKPLQVLGYWHPRKDLKKIDKKGIDSWVKKGAKLTKAVKDLI